MLCPPSFAIVKTFEHLVDVLVNKARLLIGWTVSPEQFALSLNLGIFRTGVDTSLP